MKIFFIGSEINTQKTNLSLIILVLIFFPNLSWTAVPSKNFKTRTVNIERSETFENKTVVQFKIEKKLEDIGVWKSHESECACVAETHFTEFAFNFSCILPNGFRVQVKVDCDTHSSKEKALGLYMCQNFTIWCSK